MRKMLAFGAIVGLVSLSGCNNTPREQAADNIEANAEIVADNLEEAADNAATSSVENNLQNKADATRELADNKAKDMRTNDADTNLSNGM